MKILSLSAAVGAVVLSALQIAQADISKIVRVDQNTQQLIDAEGRSRWFHGINMVKKSHPWHLDVEKFVSGWSFVDRDIELLRKMNINSVRLGVHWAGVEPVRGQYNQTFLDITRDIIKKLEENNIYTLIDQHQDVWAPQICGHGAPLWFVKSDWVIPSHRFPVPQKLTPFAVDGNGVPSDADCGSIDWATSYLNYAVGNAFGRLYNNYDNLGDSWAAYWKVLAQNYMHFPSILGYNLMNEPWVGDHMADPTLLIPGEGDRRNMEPLWNKGTEYIRTIDNTTLIFFEGSTFDILTGFNNVPGGDGSKTVHSYHYYKPPQLGSIEYTLKNRKIDSDRLRTAGMMTEFQFWDSGPDSIKDIYETMYQADRYLQSWQGWAYVNIWRGSGDSAYPHPELVRAYSRTYVEATAGVTKTMYFQESTQKYWVSWVADKSITAPSLIRFAPQVMYPDGIRVFINPPASGTYTIDNSTNTVKISYTAATVSGEVIMASVQPYYPTDIVKNPESGRCLDNGNHYVTPNNPIILWDCTSAPNQIWKFKDNTIQLAFDPEHNPDKYCLDTQPLASTTKYLNAVLNPCEAGKATQKWSVTPTGNIVNTATGFCLDINASNWKAGTQIIVYPCGAGGKQLNQVWTLPRGASGTCTEFLAGAYFDVRVEVHAESDAKLNPKYSLTIEKLGVSANNNRYIYKAVEFSDWSKIQPSAQEFWNFNYTKDAAAYWKAKDGDSSAKTLVHVASTVWRQVQIHEPGTYKIILNYNNGESTEAAWTVHPTHKRQAKNVILFIGDGMSTAMITGARLISKSHVNGKYTNRLHMDKFPVLGHIMTQSLDSLITDSANSASAYNTGHKTSPGALNVYADSSESPFDDPKQETIAELIRRRIKNGGKGGVGIVTTAAVQDATPSAVFAHTRDRDESGSIVDQMIHGPNPVVADVYFGGGGKFFHSKSGGESLNGTDYYAAYSNERGYKIVHNRTSLLNYNGKGPLLGIFHSDSMDTWLDRNVYKENLKKDPSDPTGSGLPALDQPNLDEMVIKGLEILDNGYREEGWFMMAEAALIDDKMHSLDYNRGLGDLLELDKTIGKTKEWLKRNNLDKDTLVLVTADHTHSFDVYGSVDTQYFNSFSDSEELEKKNAIGVYENAGWPSYVDTDGDGFSDQWDVRYTLAAGTVAYPSHRENFQVVKDGSRNPSVSTSSPHHHYSIYEANSKDAVNGINMPSTIDVTQSAGTHSFQDVPLFASGPGSHLFAGIQDNTEIFHKIAQVLGLGN
ncbi:hypothetical protein FBU30_004966 [Linnemannia zychae]|nr:hypothetical protein FBU30_004966 [Linnemannia zychae]